MTSTMHRAPVIVAMVVALGWMANAPMSGVAVVQGQTPPAPPTPRAQAPRDITGYWVSVVTEDWHWRMVTPRKGDYTSLPLNQEGRRVADRWDPAKSPAGDEACQPFGAAAIMRVPGRVRIGWEDDVTLKVDSDAGTQTRRFRFGRQASRGWRVNPRGEIEWFDVGRDAPVPTVPRSWQGYSVAGWDLAPDPGVVRNPAFFAGGLGTGPDGAGTVVPGRYGSLHVVTTLMKPGWLRRNGVPYSEGARLTEDYDFRTEDDGTEWFTVTTVVEDAKYLSAPFVTSTDFRKEADGTKWRPTTCSAY
ncbi:MAG TPA: hypothetical protein VI485_15430 [Vicinamibacterales bacterium]|nr:hypothetical protein [Vicinamibacterales bacterium]